MPVAHNTVASYRAPVDLVFVHEAFRKSDDCAVELFKVLLCPFNLDQVTAHLVDLKTGSLRSWLILGIVGGWVLSVTPTVSTRHGKVGSCLVGCGMSRGESMVMCGYW